jgi:FAD/FMN-containing dehydrogenase/Fe-S oxidoreductase
VRFGFSLGIGRLALANFSSSERYTPVMTSTSAATSRTRAHPGDPALAARLRRELEGDVLFDPFSRGRYSTDASHYQIEPIGVVVPNSEADAVRAMQIALDEGVPILPRGGGTSQCGQTVGEALVIDVSRHLNGILELDTQQRCAVVQPGIVLDQLNRVLAPHGLQYPVDVSTSSRATIGGMTGNNSCGARSIRYGTMRDNVLGIDAQLADGEPMHFGPIDASAVKQSKNGNKSGLIADLLVLGQREAGEIARRFPQVQRRVGGYNIDVLVPPDAKPNTINLAHLLVGSEGTLAFSRRVHLRLQPIPPHKVLGVCHFPSFYSAMDAARHIVALGPSAVELVDRTMIELSRDIPAFRDTVTRFVRSTPDALLLVEFSGEDRDAQLRGLRDLVGLMGELGFPDAVVEAIDPVFQRDVWEVRKAGLNIMMSMKGDGKPVSFIEDCAVGLEDLAEFTDRLTRVFHKHGTTGTWYAHASVGCLHVRPVLNLKLEVDARKMRAIAEEAFEMVREYKGSHSGEHGDGLVRSEFHEAMFGSRMTASFKTVKSLFDPRGLLNPGKIVNPTAMDDRNLFRFKPGYQVLPIETALDWSQWGGFGGAVEMCNNNGACRKDQGGVMCPSYRATMDEQHLTRGRANSLRLAISGQLGPDALTCSDMKAAMDLCVGCKGCRRECPTGVDMARMKVEFLHQYHRRHGLSVHERLVSHLPRYAPILSRLAPLANLRNTVPGMSALLEPLLGFSRKRRLPAWRRDPFRPPEATSGKGQRGELVLLADTFNRYFEPENLHAATRVLAAAGYRIHHPTVVDGSRRPLCCGRTFLAAGLVEQARNEVRRLLDALSSFVERGVPVVGLEPSCLLTLRDELGAMLPGPQAERLAEHALLFEEFLAAEHDADKLDLPMNGSAPRRALLHGHCHQKAFGVMGSVEKILGMVPGLDVTNVESSCCGMAGAFGYRPDSYDISMRMGELNLLPAVRETAPDTLIVADGTSCRQQIADATGRRAVHVARVLESAIGEHSRSR